MLGLNMIEQTALECSSIVTLFTREPLIQMHITFVIIHFPIIFKDFFTNITFRSLTFMNNSYMPSKFTVTFSLIVTNCTGLDNLVNLLLKFRHDY